MESRIEFPKREKLVKTSTVLDFLCRKEMVVVVVTEITKGRVGERQMIWIQNQDVVLIRITNISRQKKRDSPGIKMVEALLQGDICIEGCCTFYKKPSSL